MEFLNPPKDRFEKEAKVKETKIKNLQDKVRKANTINDYIKTPHWKDYRREKIINELVGSLGTLLREGLAMNEVDLKTVIARMRAYYTEVEDMRYAVDEGEVANKELLKYETKNK